jgi:hypothetical protein
VATGNDSGIDRIVERLSDPDRSVRLAAAAEVGEAIRAGKVERTATREINNHVHTIYSFSPYSPAAAAFFAWKAGLLTVGAMDHDSVAGCHEMLDAAASIGIASTVGFELRVNLSGTPMEGRKVNNPDSANIAYIALHGIPRRSIEKASRFLEPVRTARNDRNRKMIASLSALIAPWGLDEITFDGVRSLSRAGEGGSITERHILYALARSIVDRVGPGTPTVSFLRDRAGIALSPKLSALLEDAANPHYLYDLLGVFKGSLVKEIYLQPDDAECVPVARAIAFASEIGAIPAYAYLGDVTESPTGDKAAEAFEDSFLDELFVWLRRTGFRAVTYMPPRNTREQLARVRSLCTGHGLMEISGVDINSSRQSFNCPETALPEFRHLATAAWALIAHEKLSDRDPALGLFAPDNPVGHLPLPQRINLYGSIGEAADPHRLESIHEIAGERMNHA